MRIVIPLVKEYVILQPESEDSNMYANFAGNRKYQSVQQRVMNILVSRNRNSGVRETYISDTNCL